MFLLSVFAVGIDIGIDNQRRFGQTHRSAPISSNCLLVTRYWSLVTLLSEAIKLSSHFDFSC